MRVNTAPEPCNWGGHENVLCSRVGSEILWGEIKCFTIMKHFNKALPPCVVVDNSLTLEYNSIVTYDTIVMCIVF